MREFTRLGDGTLSKIMLAIFGLCGEPLVNRSRIVRTVVQRLIPRISLRPRRLLGARVLLSPYEAGDRVVFDEFFFHNAYDLKKVTFEPDLIIDCGAHVGLFSLLAAKTYPHVPVIAFEPDRRNIEMLRRNIAANNLNIQLVPGAVATHDGRSNFVRGSSCGGHISQNNRNLTAAEVDTVDLGQLIQLRSPNRLLLKMDIEGAERELIPHVLRVLPKQTAFFFETHYGLKQWTVAEQYLNAHGFEVDCVNMRDNYCDGFAIRLDMRTKAGMPSRDNLKPVQESD